MDNPDTVVIVPTYNEADNIDELITQLLALPVKLGVIVVDDNSPDGTGQKAEQWSQRETGRIHVVHRPGKLGLGTAYISGFRLALDKLDARRIMTMDADFSHNPRYIPAMIELSEQNDVVIGSRFCEQKEGFKSTFARRLGIRVFEAVASLLIRQRITDSTSGFRAYNRRAIDFLSTRYPQDYPEPEAVILLGKNGFTIKEVFVTMSERRGGLSSISGLSSLYYMVKVLLAIFMVALRTREPS